jgi:hypothetical protein
MTEPGQPRLTARQTVPLRDTVTSHAVIEQSRATPV